MTLVMKCRGRRDASNGILHKSTIYGRHIHFWGKLPISMSFEQTVLFQPKLIFKVQQPEGKKEIFEKKVATIISGKMHGAMRGGENTFSRHTLFLNFFPHLLSAP
mgnify:FL=1